DQPAAHRQPAEPVRHAGLQFGGAGGAAHVRGAGALPVLREDRAMHATIGRMFALAALAAAWLAMPASGQDSLPKLPPPLKGYNGLSTGDSSPPEFPQTLHAPKGAPNVLLILADD